MRPMDDPEKGDRASLEPMESIATLGRDEVDKKVAETSQPGQTKQRSEKEKDEETDSAVTLTDDVVTVVGEEGEERILISDEEWERCTENPRNWRGNKRWKNSLIISITGFLSTSGSSILVPAAAIIQNRYNVSSKEVVTLTTALYVLGLGFGPFVFAPISELYGRQVSYSVSMVGFTLLNLACMFAPSLPALIVLRFFSGWFGSSGPGLGVATISDLFAPKERGRPISIYAIGPMMGPFLGSVIGNYLILAEWRWTFRFMTLAVGLNAIAVMVFMNETYAPVVRRWKERALYLSRHPLSPSEIVPWYRRRPSFTPEAKEIIVRTFTRPPRVLANPVALIFIVYYAYVYAVIYMFLVSLPLLYHRHDPPLAIFSYNWAATTAGLVYIGLGVGFLFAALFASIMQDRIYHYCSIKYDDDGRPEYRLVATQLGMFIFPAGLLIFGWTAQAETYFLFPLLGSSIFAFGLMLTFNSIQNWIVDAFYPYSAAAMAAASLLRSITGCILPIFADSLFLELGYGLGGTTLALISLPAIPAPYILFFHGKQLRERYKFTG